MNKERHNGTGFSLETTVPTPEGWKTVGQLQASDSVYTADGGIAPIVFTETCETPVFDLTFTAAHALTVGFGQLWPASNRADRDRVRHSTRKNTGVRVRKLQAQVDELRRLLNKKQQEITMPELTESGVFSKSFWYDFGSKRSGREYLLRREPVPGMKGLIGVFDAKSPLGDALEDVSRKLANNQPKTSPYHIYDSRTMAGEITTRGVNAYKNWTLPAVEPLKGFHNELPLEPYMLGLWLADGSKECGSVTLGSEDRDTLLSILAGYGIKHHTLSKIPGEEAWHTTFEIGDGTPVQTLLRRLGALNNKHIPTEYLRASCDARLRLLQGLMDGDGTINDQHKTELCFTREQLANDAAELLRTLGILVNVRASEAAYTVDGERKVTGTRYRMAFTTELPVFSLPRKAGKLSESVQERYRQHYLDSAEPAGTQLVKSIYLGEQKQFLVGDFIPTLSAD